MKKLLLGLILLSAVPVNAASFVNGDFSAGNTAWNDASDNGSISFFGGEAVLQTGTGTSLFSAIMVQGDDVFFNFNDPFLLGNDIEFLHFDALFSQEGQDNLEVVGSGSFSDALFVSLYDYADGSGGHDLLFDPEINSTVDGMLISYALNVSSLQGREIALSFELVDDNDGFDSKVTLDNVLFAPAPQSGTVPSPSVLVLLLAGLPLLQRFTKQRAI